MEKQEDEATKKDDGYITFEDSENVMWPYGKGFYKAYTEDRKVLKELLGTKDVTLCNTYFDRGRVVGWDVVLRSTALKSVKRRLGKQNETPRNVN